MVRAIAERYRAPPGAPALARQQRDRQRERAAATATRPAAAWQRLARDAYSDVEALNQTWGTAFWGHHYTSFDQVRAAAARPHGPQPGAAARLRAIHLRRPARPLPRRARGAARGDARTSPITTNFMIMNFTQVDDYARWAEEVDIVANDHYTIGADPHRARRALVQRRPHPRHRGRRPVAAHRALHRAPSTGSPSTAPRSRARCARNSLAHIARGSDGALFFQWRMSTAAAEQFHSAHRAARRRRLEDLPGGRAARRRRSARSRRSSDRGSNGPGSRSLFDHDGDLRDDGRREARRRSSSRSTCPRRSTAPSPSAASRSM